MVLNSYLLIKPVSQGLISQDRDTCEYEVLDSMASFLAGNFPEDKKEIRLFDPGDIIYVQPENIIKIHVGGKERFYVTEDHVLERVPRSGDVPASG